MRANTRRPDDKSKMPAILALLLTFMVAVYMGGLIFFPIPEANKETLIYMGGQLATAWLLSMGYYYSTTSGSKNKDALIADSVQVQRRDNDQDAVR